MAFLLENGELIEDDELKKKREEERRKQELIILQQQEKDQRVADELQSEINEFEAQEGPVEDQDKTPFINRQKIVLYGVKQAVEGGMSEQEIESIGEEKMYQMMIDKYPQLKEAEWKDPSKGDIVNLAKVFQTEQYAYAMPAYVTNLMTWSDEGANLDSQGISPDLKDLTFEQRWIDNYKALNPEATNQEVYHELSKAKQTAEQDKRYAAQLLEDGQKYVDEAFRENPRLQATAEWLHDQKLRNFEGEQWASLLINTLPSLMTAMGAGKAGGTLGALVGGPPGAVAGYLLGAFSAGTIMEGGSYLSAGVEELTRDKEITWEQAEKVIQNRYKHYTEMDDKIRKEFFSNPDVINNMIYQNKIDPNGQKDLISSVSATFPDGSNGPGPNHGDLPIHERLMDYDEYRAFQLYNYFNLISNPDGSLNRDYLIQEGMTTEQAIDAVEASALSYSIFSGLVESGGDLLMFGMGGEVLSGINKTINDKLGLGIFSKIADNLGEVSKSVPKGSNWVQRALYASPEITYRTMGTSVGEGIEEGVQYTLDVLTTTMGPGFVAPEAKWKFDATWEEEYSYKEHMESIAGGALAGGPIGTMNLYSKVRRSNDRIINRKIQSLGETTEGEYVWAPEELNHETGQYHVSYAVNTTDDVIELMDGTVLRGSLVEESKTGDTRTINVAGAAIEVDNKDIKDIRTSINRFSDVVKGTDVVDENGNPIDVAYDNWGDAYDAAYKISKSLQTTSKKERAWQFRDIIDGESKVFMDDDPNSPTQGKYILGAYDSKGRLQYRVGAFDTEQQANRRMLEVNESIKNISEDFKKFGGAAKLAEDEDIKRFEKEYDEILDKNEVYSDGNGVNSEVVAITKFMGRSVKGVPNATVREIMDNQYPEMYKDGGNTILDIVESLKNSGQWDFVGVSEEEFKDTFDMFFKPMDPETQEPGDVPEEQAKRLNQLFSPPDAPDTPAPADAPAPGEQTQLFPDDSIPLPDDIPTPDDSAAPKSVADMSLSELDTYIAEKEAELKTIDPSKKAALSMVNAALKTAKMRRDKLAEDVVEDTIDDKFDEDLQRIDKVKKELGDVSDVEVDYKGKPSSLSAAVVSETIDMERLQEEIDAYQEQIDKAKGKLPFALLNKETKKKVKSWKERIASRQSRIDVIKARIEALKKQAEGKKIKERRSAEIAPDIVDEELTLEQIKEDLKQKLEMLVSKFRIKGREDGFKYKIYDTWNEGVNALFKKRTGRNYPGPARDENGRIIKVGGWFDPETNTIIVIADSVDAGILPFHEFAHPFLEAIAKDNPELFNQLWDNIKEDPAFESIIEQVFANYEDLGRGEVTWQEDPETGARRGITWVKEPTNAFKEEVFAHILEGLANDRYNKKPETFMEKVRAIWNAIKNWIFGEGQTKNIYVRDLKPDTTLSDLARILADSNNTHTITLEDYDVVSQVLDIADDTTSKLDVHDRDIESTIAPELTNEDIIASAVIDEISNRIDSELISYLGNIIDIENIDDTTIISSSKLKPHLPKGKNWKSLNIKEQSKVIESLLKTVKKEMDTFIAKQTEYLAKTYHVSPKLYKGKKYRIKTEHDDRASWSSAIEQSIMDEYRRLQHVISAVGLIKSVRDKAPFRFSIDMAKMDELKTILSILEEQVSFRYSFIDKHLARMEKNAPDRKIPLNGLEEIGGMHKQGQQRVSLQMASGDIYEGVVTKQDKDTMQIKMDYNQTKIIKKKDIVKTSKIKLPSGMSLMVKEFVADFKKEFPKVKSLTPSQIIAAFQAWADNKHPLYMSIGKLPSTSLSYGSLLNIEGAAGQLDGVRGATGVDNQGLNESLVHRVLLHNGKILRRGHTLEIPSDGMAGNGFGWYGVLTVPNGLEGTVGDVLLFEYQSDFFPEARALWDKFNIALEEFLATRKEKDMSSSDVVKIVKQIASSVRPLSQSREKAKAMTVDQNDWMDPWRAKDLAEGKYQRVTFTIPKEVVIDGKKVKILENDISIAPINNPEDVLNIIMISLTGYNTKEHVSYNNPSLEENPLFSDPNQKPLLEWILNQDMLQSMKVVEGKNISADEWIKDSKRINSLNHNEIWLWYPYLHKVIDGIIADAKFVSVDPEAVIFNRFKEGMEKAIEVSRRRAVRNYKKMISNSLSKYMLNAFRLKSNSKRKDLYEIASLFKDLKDSWKDDNKTENAYKMLYNLIRTKGQEFTFHFEPRFINDFMENNYYAGVILKKISQMERWGYSMGIEEGASFLRDAFNTLDSELIEMMSYWSPKDIDTFSTISIFDNIIKKDGSFKELNYELAQGEVKAEQLKSNVLDGISFLNKLVETPQSQIEHPDDPTRVNPEFIRSIIDDDYFITLPAKEETKVNKRSHLFEDIMSEFVMVANPNEDINETAIMEGGTFYSEFLFAGDFYPDVDVDLSEIAIHHIMEKAKKALEILQRQLEVIEIDPEGFAKKNKVIPADEVDKKSKTRPLTWQKALYVSHLDYRYNNIGSEATIRLNRARKYKTRANAIQTKIDSFSKAGFDNYYDALLKRDFRAFNRVYLQALVDFSRFTYDEIIANYGEYEKKITQKWEKNKDLFASISPGNPFAYGKYREIEKALEWEQNFHQIQIMHSIVHGNTLLGPDGNLYMNTGSTIALLERNDDASNIYGDSKENKWLSVRDILQTSQYNSRAAVTRYARRHNHFLGFLSDDTMGWSQRFSTVNQLHNFTGMFAHIQGILVNKLKDNIDTQGLAAEELLMYYSQDNEMDVQINYYTSNMIKNMFFELPYYYKFNALDKYNMFVAPFHDTADAESNPVINMIMDRLDDVEKTDIKQTGVSSEGKVGLMTPDWVLANKDNPAFQKLIHEIFSDKFVTLLRDSIIEGFSTFRSTIEIESVEPVSLQMQEEGVSDRAVTITFKLNNIDEKLLEKTLSGKNPSIVILPKEGMDAESIQKLSIDELAKIIDKDSIGFNVMKESDGVGLGRGYFTPGLEGFKDNIEHYFLLNSIVNNFDSNIKKSFSGPWLKALNKMKSLYNFKVVKTYPEWSKSAQYKIVIDDNTDSDLRPLRLRRIVNAEALDKTTPQTFDEFTDIFEQKIFLTPGDIESKTKRQRYLWKVFDDIFIKLNAASRGYGGDTGRVDVEKFMSHMYNILEDYNAEFIDIYESWLHHRFKNRKDKIHIVDGSGVPYTERKFKDRYNWLSSDVLERVILNEFENASEGLQRISGGNEKDESNLTLHDFRKIGAFKGLTIQDVENMFWSARGKSKDEWIVIMLKQFGKRSFTVSEHETLTKFYNQANSTVRVNQNKFRWVRGKPYPNSVSNNRVNLILEIIRSKSGTAFQVSEKEAFHYPTGKSNPEREKANLYEIASEGNLLNIHHLSGKDIHQVNIKEIEGRDDERDYKKNFGFLTEVELTELDNALRSGSVGGRFMTVIASRGDSDKLFIVEVDKQFFKERQAFEFKGKEYKSPEFNKVKSKEWFVDFWQMQRDNGFINNDQLAYIKEVISKADMNAMYGGTESKPTYIDLAAEVSIYNVMQTVWPKYLQYGSANVFKRLKIPFTPVTYSKTMPPIRPVLFDPSNFKTRFNEVEVDLVQDIGIFGPTYIGDGMSLTSRHILNEYNQHFGLKKGMRFAKTVIYEKQGDNIVMFKHLQTGLRPGLEIVDKKTNEVVWRVDKKGNIRDVSDGSLVDMLATRDEIKVAELFEHEGLAVNGGVQLEISGQSIGMIKFDDRPNGTISSGVQIYNYENSEELIDVFDETYLKQVRNRLQEFFRLAVATKNNNAGQKLSNFISKINKSQFEEGYASTAAEHIKNGSGLFPVGYGFLNNVGQSHAVLPSVQLEGQQGGRYKFRFDTTGLKRDEISITMDRNIIDEFKADGNSTENLSASEIMSRINIWLKDYDLLVKIQRYPVTSRASSAIVRVKSVHLDSKVIEVNPFLAKEDMEMDADGDEVQLEYIRGPILDIWKNIEAGKTISPINLNEFLNLKTVEGKSLLSKKDRMSQIANSTVGGQAIGMIANIATVYGIMHNVFDSFVVDGKKIIPRLPQEKMSWNVYWKGQNKWEGTVEDFIRIWVQAAVDNAEYNLLGQWGFTLKMPRGEVDGRQFLISSLFKIETSPGSGKYVPLNARENSQHKSYLQNVIVPIVQKHSIAPKTRNGFEFQLGSLNLDQMIQKSDEYLSFVGPGGSNRVQGILNLFEAIPFGLKVNIKNNRLLPIESIAISVKLAQDAIASKYELEGYATSIFELQDMVHRGTHAEAHSKFERQMGENLVSILNRMGIPENERSAVWDESLKAAEDYGVQLIKDYYALYRLKNQQGVAIDENTIDVDDGFRHATMKNSLFFKKLNPLSKALATLIYLRGYTGEATLPVISLKTDLTTERDVSIDVRVPRMLPPASQDYRVQSVLDAETLGLYFDIYNATVYKYLKGRAPGRTGNNTAWNEIKRRVCG
tara:strand:+ start:10648 stop:23826 length:13179 start_codon:yes stop_codon:yes gene_type:complete